MTPLTITIIAAVAGILLIIVCVTVGFFVGARWKAEMCPNGDNGIHSWQETGRFYENPNQIKLTTTPNKLEESWKATMLGYTAIHHKCRNCPAVMSQVILGGAPNENKATPPRLKVHVWDEEQGWTWGRFNPIDRTHVRLGGWFTSGRLAMLDAETEGYTVVNIVSGKILNNK